MRATTLMGLFGLAGMLGGCGTDWREAEYRERLTLALSLESESDRVVALKKLVDDMTLGSYGKMYYEAQLNTCLDNINDRAYSDHIYGRVALRIAGHVRGRFTGDYSEAHRWINRIQDPGLRQKLRFRLALGEYSVPGEREEW